MAIKADYQAGLATLSAGGTTVTFTGGANITAADIQPGDTFKVQNLDAIIASVTDATHVELTEPWTGAALTATPYRIRFQPDGSRYTAALRDLVAAIGGGSLAALQALTGASNKIPYFTSATTMALADFKAWALSFLSLTPAANKLAYFDSANTAALADFTAQARTLLAAASVGDQQTALGISAYIKTLLDDANAATAWATLGNTQSLGVSGYVRFPNGFIIQWGNSSQGVSDYNQGLTISFPTLCRSVSCIVDFGTMPATTFVGVLTSNLSQTGFDIRKRVMLNGGTVASEASPFSIKWIAIGY